MNPTQAQHSIKRGLQLFYHKINPSFILCVCAEVSGRASRGKPKPIGSNFSAQFVGVSKENTDLHQGGTQRQTPECVGVCLFAFICPYPGGRSQTKIPERRVHCKWPTFSIHRGHTEQRHGDPPASKKEDMLLIDQTQIKTTDREKEKKAFKVNRSVVVSVII